MTVKKISISLDERIAEQIAARAEAEGTTVSGWIARVAEDRIKIDEGLAWIEEWQEEHGRFTDEERQWARHVVDYAKGRTDTPPPEPPR